MGSCCASDALAEFVDRGCPLVLGGPLPHVMAAKAVALAEASQPAFGDYAAAVVANARALAEGLMRKGVPVVTGGTDNHLVLVDVRPFGLNGRHAEAALRASGITLNRNVLPDDTNGAWYTSGLRMGTPALTTLGMGVDEMREIADVIAGVLHATSAGVIESGPNSGKPSLVQFRLDDRVAGAARSRVTTCWSGIRCIPRSSSDAPISLPPCYGSDTSTAAPYSASRLCARSGWLKSGFHSASASESLMQDADARATWRYAATVKSAAPSISTQHAPCAW